MVESIKYIRENGSYLLFEIEGVHDTTGWCWGDMIWADGDVIEVSIDITVDELYDWQHETKAPRKLLDYIYKIFKMKGYL